ncbi:unnamed protein product [Blepharisma stoltei]|uniref:Defensin-like protein n=1 Tax=Blepharisma stoltei TaxID=1481888 RepID=A0AAU9JPY6_9CILI|nr:unnamed protein product [Blepharisma stoltei]
MDNLLSISDCYKACNEEFSVANPNRLFCKKGCDSDEKFLECKSEFCPGLCIKSELGEEDNKHGGWSKLFSRAPGSRPDDCLNACFYGCTHKDEEENDD